MVHWRFSSQFNEYFRPSASLVKITTIFRENGLTIRPNVWQLAIVGSTPICMNDDKSSRSKPVYIQKLFAYLQKFVDTQITPIAKGTNNQGAAAAYRLPQRIPGKCQGCRRQSHRFTKFYLHLLRKCLHFNRHRQ